MEKALFINGVYDDVLGEILESQKNNPGKVFYLQPYSSSAIKLLRTEPPTPDSAIPLYISTTNQLNQICYTAEIIGWENKGELSNERLASLNEQIRKFQPGEGSIYLEFNSTECVNLISIVNLRKLANQLSTSNLIKVSDEKPLKARTRAGGWSPVRALPLLSIDKSIVVDQLHDEFEKAVSQSLSDDDESRKRRLESATKYPEKVQTISFDFRRNSDVVAEVLKRANGKCELCQLDAPFIKASNGSPYLEVHHWFSLSEGGEDTVDNAGALCPNCHMQAHFGQNRDFIKSNRAIQADAKSLATEPRNY